MNVKLTDPSLLLTFEANDLEPGHSTSQTISSEYLVNRSFSGRFQKFANLKSSSDQISIQIKRKCPSIEDIIATDGNVRAVLKDGEEVIYTGYISTSYKWVITNHGEQALSITIEGVGTRLLNQPFIETGKHYFDCAASAAVYSIVHPLGITIHSGDERKILQNISKQVEAGDTCRDLLDSLFYECNAVYWFNNLGELRIDTINPSTADAQVIDYNDLYVVSSEAVSLSKTLRAYKGARITYTALGASSDYLVYRNTTNATATRICNLELGAGEYFDGAEIYTAAEWTEAMADEFREPTLIEAVNAASESSIVGSGKIVNITNLVPDVLADAGITVSFEAAGGPYFKVTCHNTSGTTQTISKLDLKADIVYEKSTGVIRTQIDGTQAGKSLLEEDLVWIHDKENATAHANLVSQYFQYAGATYTFRTKKDISTGTVIRLKEDLYSGLDVYAMITAREFSYGSEVWKYSAVGISNFDLTESAYHGTTEPAKQSGAQGPAGEPGAATEVQYALGTSLTDPPGDAMMWGGVDMLWASATMNWNTGTWEETVPEQVRGEYIWMRVRVGDAPWQYTRLTGSTLWDAENLGICTSATPTESSSGLGLIPGDYFVAGAQFTEDGHTYNAGWAYTYDGSGWDEMDLTSEENAEKAQSLLDKLVSTNTQIPESSSAFSVWRWAKNFVAQNAFISNLFSQALTILAGGHIQSTNYTPSIDEDVCDADTSGVQGFEYFSLDEETFISSTWGYGTYRVYCTQGDRYSGTWSLYQDSTLKASGLNNTALENYGIHITFDGEGFVAHTGDEIIITYSHVSTAGEGFYLGSDGSFDCHSASATNMTIRGDSLFQGRFDCDVIKTISVNPTVTGTYSAASGTSQAKNLLSAFPSSVIPSYPPNIPGVADNWSDYIQVQMTTPLGTSSDIAYVRLCRGRIANARVYDRIVFYNRSRNKLDINDYFSCTASSGGSPPTYLSTVTDGSVVGGSYATITVTIQTITGGNVLELDIPSQSQSSDLSSGQLYYDSSGYVRIKL